MISSATFWILMALTMVFGLGPSGGHEIVDLVVPLLADPRENATLSCRYNMGSDRLYSAKWFKDEKEIFRYMPGEKPAGRPFPVSGVRLARPPRCSPVTCDLELTNLAPHSAGLYRCEVSTEAPTFRIVHKSSNMTIAALPRRDPKIEGLLPRYYIGEEIRVNCTSDSSLPAADITWYVNEMEASFLSLEGFWSSAPDKLGLVRRSQGLRLVVERALFQSGSLRLRCSSTLPSRVVGGPHKRQTTKTTSLQPPAFLDKLAWLGSAASLSSKPSIYFILQLIFYLGCVQLFSPIK